MQCVIIDDEKMSRLSLARLCEKVNFIEVKKIYSSALEAKNDPDLMNNVDLIFLDIHMPDLNGFDFLKSMKVPPKVIFTSSDPSKALDAFEVEAVDYLLKPITLTRFLAAVEKLKTKKEKSKSAPEPNVVYDEKIFVNIEKRLVGVDVDKIAVIEAKGDYILIKMEDQKTHIVRSSLKNIENRLSPTKFIKVHRSFIINLTKIVDIEDSSILVNNEVIPISRSLRSSVMEKLNLL